MSPFQDLTNDIAPEKPELVFALVGPTGTNLRQVSELLVTLLKAYQYQATPIQLSDMAKELTGLGTVKLAPEFERIRSLQNAGNQIRRLAGRGDALALHAIARIYNRRTVTNGEKQPLTGEAHILNSLKHPAEVQTLRRVYGLGFFLIGVHASHDDRRAYLEKFNAMTSDQATALMSHDESEADEEFGQQTRSTFQMADVFIKNGTDSGPQLRRFLQLVFGAPYETPTPDEHSMFLAFAASLRSAQPSRQVGAVVTSAAGEVIGTGANDVPKSGGGLYWSDSPNDQRDHNFDGGIDSNKKEISEIMEEIRSDLGALLVDGTSVEAVKEALRNCRINDITEFGRAVHAEMEALLACARIGVSVQDGKLFTTTFPCHNCAKHIVAAGIKEVVFVEPYPKSKASQLHDDSIAVDVPNADGRVLFRPFVGVAARRYFDLFSMKLNTGTPLARKDRGWKESTARARNRMSPLSYIGREPRAFAKLSSGSATDEAAKAEKIVGKKEGTKRRTARKANKFGRLA